jgi:PAS domain S-box-containing protein
LQIVAEFEITITQAFSFRLFNRLACIFYHCTFAEAKPMTIPEIANVIKPSKLLFKTQGNECATLIEGMDWSKTSLGPIENWPVSLHITLATLLNSRLPMALFWGTDYIFFYNDAARFRTGGRHPFVLGKKAKEFLEEQWPIYKSRIDHVLETGESTWFEDQPIPLKGRNNKLDVAYSSFSYSPVYDDKARRVAVLIAGIDTTEKVTNFRKLEESDRKFRNLVDQAPIGIAILKGEDFEFELANEYYQNLIGTPDSLIGKRIQNVLKSQKAENIKNLLDRVRETGVAFHGKESIVTNLFGIETKRYTNSVYEPLRESNGRIDRILVLVTDVSEQVRSIQTAQVAEKELRQMADAMPHLVWIANPEGTVTFISDRVAEFSGATRKADGTWRWDGMVHPEDVEATNEKWRYSLKHGSMYEKEHRLMMLDGTYRWHISRAFPFKNTEGEISKWFGTATNIDDQKRLSEELEIRVSERTKELQSSNNELAQFAYVASHDLQEPLRKIITFIELLQRDLPSLEGKTKGYLQKIEQSAVRMSILIKDILNFSQLGKPGHAFEQTDLNDTIKTIVGDLEVVIQQKSAQIQCDNLPTLEAIPQQMNQLFYNLLSNSLKFTAEGTVPVIRITARELQRKEILKYSELNPALAFCSIQFQDNGIGFNQKFADQIFTIFQRLNNRQSYSGTGIGLALCKKIAINHNGLIQARSVENQGATFEVVLPVKQPRG